MAGAVQKLVSVKSEVEDLKVSLEISGRGVVFEPDISNAPDDEETNLAVSNLVTEYSKN